MKRSVLKAKAFELLNSLSYFTETEAIGILASKLSIDKYTAKKLYLEWVVSRCIY